MNPAILIQVSLKSQRCRMKALRMINGKPLIDHLIDRLKQTGLRVIICTTCNERDSLLYRQVCWKDIEVFRGHEENLAARFFDCANKYNIDPIIRVTGDNPMTDPDLIIKQLGYYNDEVDYVYPNMKWSNDFLSELVNRKSETAIIDDPYLPGKPRGVKSEIIRPSVLTRMHEVADQEHCFSDWLKNNTRSVAVDYTIEYESYTCDTEEDLNNIRRLYGHRPFAP